jgi:hypothetical protein
VSFSRLTFASASISYTGPISTAIAQLQGEFFTSDLLLQLRQRALIVCAGSCSVVAAWNAFAPFGAFGAFFLGTDLVRLCAALVYKPPTNANGLNVDTVTITVSLGLWAARSAVCAVLLAVELHPSR